jgi:general secretion pathway protein G
MHDEKRLRRFLVQLCLGLLLPVSGCITLVAIAVVPNLEASRIDRRRLDISNLDAIARSFRAKNGRPPRNVEELVLTGYLERMPRDPWGRPYGYWRTRERDLFVSFGLDGVCGGSGPAAELASNGYAPSQEECLLRQVSCF